MFDSNNSQFKAQFNTLGNCEAFDRKWKICLLNTAPRNEGGLQGNKQIDF